MTSVVSDSGMQRRPLLIFLTFYFLVIHHLFPLEAINVVLKVNTKSMKDY